MTPGRLRTTLTTLLALAALGAALLLLAPVQLGGRTGYVITAGTSMEPSIHAGDLVVTRARATYDVGDVVLYRSATLDQDVLHRIVARDGNRFVLRGDHNGYRDADHPGPGRIVGELWLRVPAVGGALSWLGRPPVFALLAFLLVFAALAGGKATTRSGRTGSGLRERRDGATVQAAASTVAVGALAALVLFAVLGVVAWTRPATRDASVAGTWAHTGTFSYAAAVPRSAVYPTGTVETGDAAFTRLVRSLDIAFTYRFESRARTELRGGILLDATVSDGQGWSRRLPLASSEPFAGASATVAGTLDLRAVRALVDRMRRLTGSTATQFTVSVAPIVDLAGYTGARVLDERYAPTLPLSLDATALRPTPASDGAPTSFVVREPGSSTRPVPLSIGAGPVGVGVEHARVLGLLGVAAAAVVALLALALALRSRPGARDVARNRFGGRLVAASTVVPDGRWVTDVDGVEELARIAEHFDRLVLHGVVGHEDVYLVDDGVAVYRLVVADDVSADTDPVPAPVRGR